MEENWKVFPFEKIRVNVLARIHNGLRLFMKNRSDLFYNILSDCHYSDVINSLLNAFRLRKIINFSCQKFFRAGDGNRILEGLRNIPKPSGVLVRILQIFITFNNLPKDLAKSLPVPNGNKANVGGFFKFILSKVFKTQP